MRIPTFQRVGRMDTGAALYLYVDLSIRHTVIQSMYSSLRICPVAYYIDEHNALIQSVVSYRLSAMKRS